MIFDILCCRAFRFSSRSKTSPWHSVAHPSDCAAFPSLPVPILFSDRVRVFCGKAAGRAAVSAVSASARGELRARPIDAAASPDRRRPRSRTRRNGHRRARRDWCGRKRFHAGHGSGHARRTSAAGLSRCSHPRHDDNPSFDDRAAAANAPRRAIFVSFHVSSTGKVGTARAYSYPLSNLSPPAFSAASSPRRPRLPRPLPCKRLCTSSNGTKRNSPSPTRAIGSPISFSPSSPSDFQARPRVNRFSDPRFALGRGAGGRGRTLQRFRRGSARRSIR